MSAAHGDPPQIGTPEGDAMLRALRIVPSLLRNTSQQNELQKDPEAQAKELGLPKQAGPVLLHILNTSGGSEKAEGHTERRLESDFHSASDNDMRKTLMQPFGQITWSFRILVCMSVLMFLVGLVFLVFALVEMIGSRTLSASSLAIAGVGLADFLLLFYRRPWEDIARGVSNSQQARIIATSYLSGISMLDPRDPGAQAALQGLTRQAVELIEGFTEPTIGACRK
jgi:hypothetical protein